MAQKGTAYFDARGKFFKTPEEATQSDLSHLLGQIGEGDSLAPGIAFMMLDRREEIEAIFAQHDAMLAGEEVPVEKLIEAGDNVEPLHGHDKSEKAG